MKSNLDTLEGLNRKLSVTVPKETVQQEFDKAYQGIRQNAEIKGFRKGKAPLDQIKALYAERVQTDVIDKLVSKSYQEALHEHELVPLGYPKLQFDEVGDDKDLNYTAEFEVRPDVKVESYEGLDVEKERIDVDAAKIDKVLEDIRASKADMVPVLEDRPAKTGDSAQIDFDGFVDNAPLEGGSAKDHILEIGSGQFIDGFEEQVEGMKIGEEKEIQLKFPEQYHNDDIAGKPVTFKVKLTALKKKSLPEINDELAKQVGEFETLDDLKKAVKEDIENQENQRVQEELRNKVLKALVDKNPVEAPVTLKQQQKEMIQNDVHQKMKQQGLGDKEFEEYKEKWDEDFEKSAEFMVQSTFLVDALADKLSLRATPQDVEARLKMQAMQMGLELDQLKQYYEKGDQLSRLSFQLTEEKVVAHLIEKANVKEVDPQPEEQPS